jgi:hypothetical protein
MKKSLLLFCFSAVFLSIHAQKQDEGSQTIEMEFAPLGSEPFKINALRYRYFLQENLAIRGSIFMGGKRNTTLSDTTGGIPLTKGRNGNFDFSIRPGIEKHFEGTDKLSPYVGAELFFGMNTTKDNQESLWSDNETIQSAITKTSSSSFGSNILMGMDYYISDHLFLGAELGFGLLLNGRGKTKTSYDNPEFPIQDSEIIGNTKELNWGPNYQGTIRFGWVFK